MVRVQPARVAKFRGRWAWRGNLTAIEMLVLVLGRVLPANREPVCQQINLAPEPRRRDLDEGSAASMTYLYAATSAQ